MEGNKLLLRVGSSAQEEEVRKIKPELMSFLRKELQNSEIELTTSIEKVESERTHLSDQEKMQILIQKNPELIELAQKFNLGFNS
jgi:flagellar biosynthesis protein FliP